MALLEKFQFSDSHCELGIIQGSRSLFADYVHDRLTSELASWDVAIPAYLPGRGDAPVDIGGYGRTLVKRDACYVEGDLLKLTSKNKAANPGDEKIGLDSAAISRAEATGEKGAAKYCRERARPLLLIHIVNASVRDKDNDLKIESPVVSLSFCMPTTRIKAVARQYMVNVRYKQLMLDLNDEPDDDEAILDEASNG